jgi:short-subunit dehydrogenase
MSEGTVVIIGATSAIARALAAEFAADGRSVILASRDLTDLERIAGDVRIRFGPPAHAVSLDVAEGAAHEAFVARCLELGGGKLDGVVYFSGYMAEQRDAEKDPALARQTIEVNYTAAVLLLNRFAAVLEQQQGGFICGISSVAGDRGRQSNYIYGSAKAALTTYLEGLRHHLYKAKVSVQAIKLGFVDTAMTWGLLKQGSPLVASPQKAATLIHRHIRKRAGTKYVPGIWAMIMLIIRTVPGALFYRTKL